LRFCSCFALQQAKTVAGIPFCQVRLIHKPSEPVGKVLGEGDRRCVALAAFLAELSTIDAQPAIVLIRYPPSTICIVTGLLLVSFFALVV
jgi:hypothetical protein